MEVALYVFIGLAKMHKEDTPVRPALSMSGSAYRRIANQVADWLKVVPDCNINSSTKTVADNIRNVKLEPDEELVSFDVTLLYTNVPMREAIMNCTKLLYSGKYTKPRASEGTFIEVAKLYTCDILALTHDGYYRQMTGLAKPIGIMLANGLSKVVSQIKDSAKLYN